MMVDADLERLAVAPEQPASHADPLDDHGRRDQRRTGVAVSREAEDSIRARRASASSASATSACRSPSSSRRPASTSPASTSIASKVAEINAGRSYIPDVAAGASPRCVNAGRLRATTDMTQLGEMDAIDICVPTPLRKTKDPDLSYVVQAVEAVARRHLQPGQLVILESTTYPGTTDESCSRCSRPSGLKAGDDFFLAFSPERVDPGQRAVHTTRTSRRSSAASSRPAPSWPRRCTRSIVDTVVPVSSTRVAEMVKLLENTFRAVNIGLVNEIALMCHKMDIDVWEVIDAAKTKPFGFMPFYPGPGLGGHCIPIDPFYLSWKARQSGFECRFIELAGQVNGSMPRLRRRARRRCAEHARRSRSTARASTCSASPTSTTSTTCASRRRSTS